MLIPLIALMALQQTAIPQTAPPSVPSTPPVVTAPAPARRAPVTPTSIELRVTDRGGGAIARARVFAEGPSSRDGLSDASGSATLRTLTPGVYRIRAEAEGYVALEKEVTVRAGAPAVEFPLTRAPEPPPATAPVVPAAPQPVVQSPVVVPGDPRVLSLLDVAEGSLSGKEPIRTVPIGCSGLSRAQLVVVRDTLAPAVRPDADDMLYVIAGEGLFTVGGKAQTVSAGWFSIVPRGTSRTLVRKGKNPMVLLVVTGGPSCTAP